MALVRLRRGLVCALAGMTLACGDSLVDAAYSGTPVFALTGSVTGSADQVGVNHPEVTLAVFWLPHGPAPDAREVRIEQPGTAVRAEYFRPFTMKLFDEPRAEYLFTTASGARYGAAWIGAYVDTNGNGRKDAAEPIIGSSQGRVLIRAPEALRAEDSPTGAPLAAGWYVISMPLDCPRPDGSTADGASPPPVADGDCGVPIGAICKSDLDCGAGVCVHDFISPWPSGACAIPEPPRDGCRQRGSVLVDDPVNPEGKKFWFKSCEVTADCGRSEPYQCDQRKRACMPTTELLVDMNGQELPPSICGGALAPPPGE